jgi:hypothetical protein
MGIFARSLAATLVAIPVLVVFYFVIFPSDSNSSDALGFMLIAVFFLGIPLFLVMFAAIALLSKRSGEPDRDTLKQKLPGSKLRSTVVIAAGGFAIAGGLALLITGIIWEVWLIFAAVGGILGTIIGVFRR